MKRAKQPRFLGPSHAPGCVRVAIGRHFEWRGTGVALEPYQEFVVDALVKRGKALVLREASPKLNAKFCEAIDRMAAMDWPPLEDEGELDDPSDYDPRVKREPCYLDPMGDSLESTTDPQGSLSTESVDAR